MTSHPAIKTDMKNAGADYQESGVFVWQNFITAQGPKDIDRFSEEIIKYLKQ